MRAVCVCVVCVHVYVCMYTCACVYACMCMHACVHVYACMCACVCVHVMCMCMLRACGLHVFVVCVHVCMHACVCVHVYVCMCMCSCDGYVCMHVVCMCLWYVRMLYENKRIHYKGTSGMCHRRHGLVPRQTHLIHLHTRVHVGVNTVCFERHLIPAYMVMGVGGMC